MLNRSPTGGPITCFVLKTLKPLKEMSFLILNYFIKSSLLISTYTWPVDYQKQKTFFEGPLFTYGCINQGVKHWLFFSNYRIKIVKVKDYNCKCFNIANLVNAKVAKVIKYQPHGGSNHLLSVKKNKCRKKDVLVISSPFHT